MKQLGFSLVEVVIALAVISFALLVLIGLLPIALRANQSSAQETQATCILSGVAADLRNSYPAANNGKSRYYGLRLPYTNDAYGRTIADPNLPVGIVSSIGLSANEATSSPSAIPPPTYQVSVVYTRVATAGMHSAIEAHLVVGWPCHNTSNLVALTSPTNNVGYVESYVSFPAP
ncbi:MAG TPA: prepilin-type N-terminal cleavage/methylation domain-containing protein [Candidatus Methylacidiphilales bacterium]